MMNKINERIFESYWKVNDKEWLKQRRKDWTVILLQLNRLHDSHGDFNSIRKKDFSFFKNYFMTGRATPETPIKEMPFCLAKHGKHLRFYMLLQFWFCPDHSAETLDYIKTNAYLRVQDADKQNEFFESACFAYRKTYQCYSGKYRWIKEEGTTAINGPVFGDLEPKMLELFTFNSDSIRKFEDITSRDNRNNGIESAFWRIFRDYHPKLGEGDGYNPHNPAHNLIDEYVRWGFPRDHGELFSRGGKPNECIVAYALIMYLVDTPNDRHQKQLEFAKALKERIIESLPNLTDEAQTRWDTAVKFYKEGGLKPIVFNYQL